MALTNSVEGQTKTVTLVLDGQAEPLHTRAATVADFLLEQNIVRHPEDALDVDPTSSVADGETIRYRASVPLTLVIDDVPQTVRTTDATVGAVLAQAGVVYDRHDLVTPAPGTPVADDLTVRVDHVASWVERVRTKVPAPVKRLATFDLPIGSVRVVQAGAPGIGEVSYLVTRQADRNLKPSRTRLAMRILRRPRPRVIAAGVSEYAALADLAKRGFAGTIRLAKAAIRMVATAYTANCFGCSGWTKSGQHAGHGIVAVDPAVIPLGSHLYIPGYGKAIAGDTGGAIQGRRVDLGFNNYAAALQFGRRNVVVYVVK
jgi:3D (Asp-Asp-Asp) domain-containing protein